MSRISRYVVLAVVAFLLVALGAAAPVAQSAQSATTFSGQATAIKGTVAGTAVNVADTGSFENAQRINEHRSVACYAVPDSSGCALNPPNLTGKTLSADVLHATVVARGNTSRAETYVASFNVDVAGYTISGTALDVQAVATCNNGTITLSGGVDVASLNVNGTPIDVGTGGTQAVTIGGIQIGVLNEQTQTAGNKIEVNGLHLMIPGVAGVPGTDVVIGYAEADINTCAALPDCPGSTQFVTGGGFITDAAANKLHFAAAGRNMQNWGHVLYRGGANNVHVKDPYGVVVGSLASIDSQYGGVFTAFHTAYANGLFDKKQFDGAAVLTWPSGTSSLLSGDLSAGEVLLIDMHEPGRGNDFFEIASGSAGSLASIAGGFLAGGNVQMHGKCL